MSCFKRITNQFANKAKLTLTAIACSAVLLTGMSIASAASDYSTIYHVYVDGVRVGVMDSKESYDQFIENKLANYYQENDDYTYVIGQNVALIPEKTILARTNDQQTLQMLDEILTVEAKAVALKIDEENVLYVKDEKEAENVLTAFKLQYVTEEQLIAVTDESIDKEQIPEVGERIVQAIDFTLPVEIVEGSAPVQEILDEKQALKKLNLGTLEEKKYVVQAGDVLGTIAEKFDLTVKQLLKLNPQITQDSLLHIGDELNVTEYEPLIKVVVKEVATIKEAIPFETEVVENENMWKGDSKVTQEGSKGSKIASYTVVKENGETIQREVLEETIIKEPVNRVVVKGTKVSPSRGTGQLSWPAVGGYISSYQGMRWGRLHKGIDIAGPSNLAILAADNGTVTYAGWNGGYGNMVQINHNNGMTTLYAHLSSIDVSVGQVVGKGQKIGIMGTTGNSTGIHLHFEVYKNGQLQNPIDYLR